ncbi:hypothetical protein M23134_00379 [Microscilla marina ATCC 23134]|uniref:Uncharacterized protein n=1 Tax=Microscilla marina ATCC 23134 TaxID=313606 RepID=A1ZIV9_MICM2|nr:hypothetical protein M23134_00379 [Microscilla marina ATCC 23134]
MVVLSSYFIFAQVIKNQWMAPVGFDYKVYDFHSKAFSNYQI